MEYQLSLFDHAKSPAERRDEAREALVWAALLVTEAGSFPCTIVDISRHGAKLQLAAPILSRQPVELIIEALGSLGVELAWQLDDAMGVRFTAPPAQVAATFAGVLKL